MTSPSSLRIFLVLGVLCAVGLGLMRWGPERLPEAGALVSWSGATMGTTYEIQLPGSLSADRVTELKGKVAAELAAVNAAMSTYLPDSEISAYNRMPAGEWMEISPRFGDVVARAKEVHLLTGGALDPTLGPLIDLWGFGAAHPDHPVPTRAEIEQGLAETGFDKVIPEGSRLGKERTGLQINLSAIAKGYAVDRVAALLRGEGFKDLYVEIGGELACAGMNARGIPWRIGIQVPAEGAGESAMRVLMLADRALATSGDYRNFVGEGAERRHHILDPRSGRPAQHGLASVSVLAPDCMTADALATALYVMGTEEGMAWLEDHPEVEALFIDRTTEGFVLTATEGFQQAMLAVP